MSDLTDRQRAVYAAIVAHYAATGAPPTLRDLMTALRYTSTNAVTVHLRPLAKKGVIVLSKGQARGIVVPALAEATKRAAAELATTTVTTS